jgi:invasion protein IalB
MMAKTLRLGAVAAVAVLSLSAVGFAQEAQQQQQPKPTLTKEIGSWTVQCFEQGGASRCKMVEILVNKKTGVRVLGISLQYIAEQKRSVVEIGVPLGTMLQSGAVLKADTYKSDTLHYSICDQQGCYVMLVADDKLAAAIGKATNASMEWVGFGDGKKVTLAFPLDGFSAAYQEMVSSSSAAKSAASTGDGAAVK